LLAESVVPIHREPLAVAMRRLGSPAIEPRAPRSFLSDPMQCPAYSLSLRQPTPYQASLGDARHQQSHRTSVPAIDSSARLFPTHDSQSAYPDLPMILAVLPLLGMRG